MEDTENIILDSFQPQLIRRATKVGIGCLAHAFVVLHGKDDPTIVDGWFETLPRYWRQSFEHIIEILDDDIKMKNAVRAESWRLLNAGLIERGPCAAVNGTCPNTDLEMHHHDYRASAKKITWLCRAHHIMWHKKLRDKNPPKITCSAYESTMLKLAVEKKEFTGQDSIIFACFKEDEKGPDIMALFGEVFGGILDDIMEEPESVEEPDLSSIPD